jgi:hypothetical protein
MGSSAPDTPAAVFAEARCGACGGAVPVFLSRAPACAYCGSTSPLVPRVAARLAHVASLLARRTAREEQLVGRQARLGTSFTVPMLAFGVFPAWLLVGLGALVTFPRPGGVGLARFLFREPPAAGTEGVVLWWALLLLATAFALTTLLWGVGLLRLRGLVRFAAPEPPAIAGGPLRCRCCGSGLEGEGPLVRCRSCRADHLLSAAATRPAEESMETALRRYESRLSVTLEGRARAAFRLLALAGSAPIALALLSPLGLLAPGGTPGLWAVPVLVLVAGIALLAAAARVPVPRIRTLEAMRRGDAVEVGGERSEVVGVFRLGGLQAWSGLLALLSPAPDAAVAGALHVRSVAGAEPLDLTLLAVAEPAGSADGPAVAETYPVSASAGSEWLGGPELCAVVRVAGGRLAWLELHPGRVPTAGSGALVAFRAVATPEESSVLLVARPPER